MTNKNRISWQELITETMDILGDPDGNRFSPAWVEERLNEGQYYYVKYTHYLRGRQPITSKENQSVYNFPDDCIQPIRLEDKNGNEIKQSNADHLEDVFPSFRGRTGATGDPLFYYSDYCGEGQFELHPRPTTSLEKTGVVHDGVIMDVIGGDNNDSGSISVLAEYRNKIYALMQNTDYLRIYDINGDQLVLFKQVSVDTDSGSSFVIMNNLGSSSNDIYYHKGAVIKKIDSSAGYTDNAYKTEATTIAFMFPDKAITETIFYQNTSGDVYKLITNTQVTSAVSGMTGLNFIDGNIQDYATQNIYCCFGTDGLWKITQGGVGTRISTDNINAIAQVKDNTIYVANLTSGKIATLDTNTDTLTDTTLDVHSTTKFFSNSDSTSFFAQKQDDTTNTVVSEYKDGAVLRTFKLSEKGDLGMSSIGDKCVHKNNLYTKVDRNITRTFLENGIVAYIDGIIFNSEEGVISDISDSEDVFNFSQEEGVVSQIISNAEAMYVNYIRCPVISKLEIEDYRALIDWVKFAAKSQEKDSKNINEAVLAERFFEKFVGKEASRSIKGWSPRSRGIKSYFM